MSRLDAAGALVASPAPVTSGRVLAKWEYGGSWVRVTTRASEYKIWSPTVAFKKGRLYWVVGGITLTVPENISVELVVHRAGAGVDLQKVNVGGGRDTSTMLTNHSVFISAMFTPDADIAEVLWVAINAPEDPLSMDTAWRKELMQADGQRHNIYLIDMGPADMLVPDLVSGHTLDNAGALVTVPAKPSALVANYFTGSHVTGAQNNQTQIMSATWTPKAGHQYLVIAAFTALHIEDNNKVREYWLYDAAHGVNPAKTRIGTFGGYSHNMAQERPVALVKVLDGSGSAAIWGNRKGDGDWLTGEASHRMIVLDLGPK